MFIKIYEAENAHGKRVCNSEQEEERSARPADVEVLCTTSDLGSPCSGECCIRRKKDRTQERTDNKNLPTGHPVLERYGIPCDGSVDTRSDEIHVELHLCVKAERFVYRQLCRLVSTNSLEKAEYRYTLK